MEKELKNLLESCLSKNTDDLQFLKEVKNHFINQNVMLDFEVFEPDNESNFLNKRNVFLNNFQNTDLYGINTHKGDFMFSEFSFRNAVNICVNYQYLYIYFIYDQVISLAFRFTDQEEVNETFNTENDKIYYLLQGSLEEMEQYDLKQLAENFFLEFNNLYLEKMNVDITRHIKDDMNDVIDNIQSQNHIFTLHMTCDVENSNKLSLSTIETNLDGVKIYRNRGVLWP